ncbi:MAG: metallophosphoesterase family protein, partial [Cyclobacteriaceae bacterium]
MRLFALSDIHSDFAENYKWIENLSQTDYTNDILVLAGDIAHNLRIIEATFSVLRKRFSRVFYVSGNHDLWTVDYSDDSFEKEKTIFKLAKNSGIDLDPAIIGDYQIVPLYGWYDLSFGNISQTLNDAWQDFVWCRWPDNLGLDDVTSHFLQRNMPVRKSGSASRVITFSHFLPRIDI